ncbi:MAG TPA: XRE family transcriptional regulator [Gammaproteobacteria bacterium]|nr:XRE family transcriptional regulator [Gammaproteobacteria bacterium]
MQTLKQLGDNLRMSRKKSYPHDDMSAFASRVGVSRATLQKMEKGDLSVSVKYYFQAAKLLDAEQGFSELFKLEKSLFDD